MFSTNEKFRAPSIDIEKRIDSTIEKLTLEEKIDLLGGNPKEGCTKGNERLGIPAIKMADGPVGIHWWCKSSTAYPALLAASASWDREILYKMGWGIGRDARARGVHVLLAPGVNIYRSSLCGRNFEYLGEDPFLSSEMVVEYVKGVQSMGVAATVKHYAVNYQEFERNNVSSDADERTLHEIYLPAFKAAVQKGGAGAIMTAYNLVNGVHCSEHWELIVKVLKQTWGFDGLVMSDWDSVYSAMNAAMGGLDLEMPFAKHMNAEKLIPLINEKRVTVSAIDDKIRRMLRLAACFGWLDNEQKDDSIPMEDKETWQVALDIARNGTVLLKNDGNFLPLDKSKVKKLAVIGINAAETPICGGGSAYTPPNHLVNILDGLKAIAGDKVEIAYAKGDTNIRIWNAVDNSEFTTKSGQKGLDGDYFNSLDFSGSPVLKRVDSKLSFDWYNKVPGDGLGLEFSVRWSGFIKPKETGEYQFYIKTDGNYCKITIDGKIFEKDQKADPLHSNVYGVIRLEKGKNHDIQIEVIKKNAWTSTFIGFELLTAIEKDRKEVLEAVKNADAVVLCLGYTKDTEGEGYDRPFELPIVQLQQFEDVVSVNKNIIVALSSGGCVDMEKWLDKTKSLLQIWYPGQEGGTAIAEILFGIVNPSGKLPATFERKLEDRSSFNSYHDTDKDNHVVLSDTIYGGYRHFDRTGIKPLFSFGFGLSYTTFAFENLKLSSSTMKADETLQVFVDVINTGSRAGAEVVQMYIRDPQSRLPRPVKELKGFEKVYLEKGERKTVTINIGRESLSYYDPSVHDWIYEPGSFELHIGTSASDILMRTEFTAL